jgi:hypothetical protein
MANELRTCEGTRRRTLSPWELRSLLTPMHEYRRTTVNAPKNRSHFVAVLAFVYRNRLALACQIQRRFANVLKSERLVGRRR